ncbi:MAG: hypothetical protein R3C14_23275 [Caldilineaceae bacterium]
MFRQNHIPYRLLLLLLLLTQQLAMSVPARAATRLPFADSCSAAAAQSTNVAASKVYADDEEAPISGETTSGVLYRLYWLPKTDLQTQVYHEMMAVIVRYSDMQYGTDKLIDYLNKVEFQLEHNPFTDESTVVHVMLNTALDTPGLAKYVPGIWQKLTAYEGNIFDANEAIGVAARDFQLPKGLADAAEEALIELHDCAQENPVVAEVVDKVHSKMKGSNNTSIRDNAKTILAKNPDLPVLQEIRDRLGDDGALTISLNELKELSKSEMEQINGTLDEMQGTLNDIEKDQKVIIDYLQNAELKAKWQEVMQKKAAAYQLKLEAAQAGISIITTIAAQIDPKYAKDFSVVATSSLKVATSINSWLKATAGLGAVDKVFSLSSVVMTGNVLGAVMNIVSLFGDDQPSPEQMILDEIGKLRQQVDQLRVEMHERFDRIDQSLNTIYTTMHERFDQIDIQLGKINGNIQEVQQSLAELDLKLSRIERNNFEFLNALGRRPLLEAINGGLGYQQRTGQPMPYQPDFVTFENTLHTWATIHAFDPLNAGPTQRDFSDGQTLAELNAYPFDANINYINGWLAAHGLPGITNKRLPSPRDWLFASRAYTQLALEWPEHMQRIDPKRGEALSKIGEDLESAMRNLSTLQVMSNTVGNQLLFSSVITNYQNKVDALDSSIAAVETAYMNEVRAGRLQRTEPFLVHGGAYQSLTYRAPGVGVADCGNPAENSYRLPSQLTERIPSFDVYNLAEYFKLGKFSACAFDRWANITRVCTPAECYDAGDHKVILQITFEGTLVMQQTVPTERMRVPADGNWVHTYWALYDMPAKFAASPLTDPLSAVEAAALQKLFDATLKKVETQLSGYEHELYGRILNEMNSGALKGPVTEVDGSKALIDTVIALGLPRAASNDEFLHGILYGNQQLIDEQPLIQSYVSRLAQPIEGSNLSNNPRFLLATVADQRREALQGLVDQYLAGITAHEYTEEADYIASTRRAIELTMRIVKVENSDPATTSNRVFLPLVHR